MCYTQVTAFRDSDGNLHPDEKTAIKTELMKLTGNTGKDTDEMMGNASAIVVLLQRHLAMVAPKYKNKGAFPEADKDPKPEQDPEIEDEADYSPRSRARMYDKLKPESKDYPPADED